MLSYEVRHFTEISSTNDEVIRLAENGAREGVVITCDFQTEGRGREGRKWISGKGENLLLSVLVRPQVLIAQLPTLTYLAAQAVQDVLSRFCIESTLKRPNDVLVRGQKIAGILTESRSQKSRIDWCVVGVGLNVNSSLNELPPEATSMKELAGPLFDLERVKMAYLECFNRRYQSL